METIPPEIVLHIYTFLDGRSATRFSGTCRDIRNVYCCNPSKIRLPEIDIDIGVQDDRIDLILIAGNKLKIVNIVENDMTVEQEMEDFDIKLVMEHKSHMPLNFRTGYTFFTLDKVLENITTYCDVTLLKIMENPMVVQICSRYITKLETLQFENCDFSYDGEEIVRFMSITKPSSLSLEHCNILCRPFFTDELINYGMSRLKDLQIYISHPTKVTITNLSRLIRKPSITSISLSADVFCEKEAVLERIMGWIRGEHEMDLLNLACPYEEYHQIAEAIHPYTVSQQRNDGDPFKSQVHTRWLIKNAKGARKMVMLKLANYITITDEYGRDELKFHREREYL